MTAKPKHPEAEGRASADGQPARSDVALADTMTSGGESGEVPRADPIAIPASGGPHSFAPGDLVAGRYQIIRFIAQGGMGEVYEASDRELRSSVALKTVRMGRVSERAVERLKREIHLARQVTHPNVCRIFDVGFHLPAGAVGEAEGARRTVFLTMELLGGETLSARVGRGGPMTTAEALPLVRQMAAGLDAAHAQAIVHRDFKPDNVFLVPSPKADSGIRVVITDFGVARGEDGEVDAFAHETLEGALVGTPRYMAPEQRRGAAISTATDLYAFGLVIHELVTGQLPDAATVDPFSGAAGAPGQSSVIKDPKWAAVIGRLLSPDPPRRYSSAMEAVAALHPTTRRRIGGPLQIALAALIAMTLTALVAIPIYRRWAVHPVAAQVARPSVKPRPSVAVLGFKNLSGRAEAAWISAALTQMLQTELAAGEQVRVVSGEDTERMKLELALPEADSFSKETLARIRKNLDTSLIVLGSYLATGVAQDGPLRVDLRLQDAATGDVLLAQAETDTQLHLPELVSRAGSRLRSRLGIAALTDDQVHAARSAQPANPEAARLLAEGLLRLRRFEPQEAQRLLERAIALEPDHPLLHYGLAQALDKLGYGVRAREEAKQALDRSGALSREERLLIEASYHRMAHEWDRAIERYRTLFSFFPDNLEYGLALSQAQFGDERISDGEATLAALRKLPGEAATDPRIDLMAAGAYSNQTTPDPKASLDAAVRAAAAGQARGTPLLVAEARFLEAWQCYFIGDYPRALTAAREARRLGQTAGSRVLEALGLCVESELRAHMGELSEGTRLEEEAIQTQRVMGNVADLPNLVGGTAQFHLRLGKLMLARQRAEEGLALGRQYGNPTAINGAGVSLGWIDHVGGARLEEGRQHLLSAVETVREDKVLRGWALYHLGDLLLSTGDLVGARVRLEESLAVRTQLGASVFAGESRQGLARLFLEEGKLDDAEKLARAAVAAFDEAHAVDYAAGARAGLAQVLLARNAAAEARQVLAPASLLAARTDNVLVQFAVGVAAASLQATGSTEEARAAVRDLGALAERARKLGYHRYEFEARLALGTIERSRLSGSAGASHLAALAKEAGAQGFGLIARKAESAIGREMVGGGL